MNSQVRGMNTEHEGRIMNRIRQNYQRYSVLLIALLACTGCTTTSLLSKFTHKHKFAKATAENPAVRCLCLWEAAEGTGVDNKPSRGVSGQIFFFTRGNVSSVEVDGDVRIYLFDDHGAPEDQSQPLHQFDFKGGTWKAHLTSTQFGPAYQLFVPYSRKGYHQAELALRVQHTPPNGSPLYSDLSRVSLLGYERAKEKEGDDAYEPEAPHATDGNFSRSEKITPQLVGETLFQVLAERRESADSSDLSAAAPAADLRSNRPARRMVAAQRHEPAGQFNVIDDPNQASTPAIPRSRQHVQTAAEVIDSENEE